MTTTNRWLIRFRCNFGIREMYHRFTLRLLLALICRQKDADTAHRDIGTNGKYKSMSHSGL